MFAASKKRVTVVIAILGAIALSTAAYAYWTQGGSGTGSASTGDTVNLTVVQDTVLVDMYPGDSAQGIDVTVTNPNAAAIKVTKVTASIDSVTPAGAGTCDATDYTLGTPVMTDGADEIAGGGTAAFSGASIRFNNKASNQDGCKLADVTLKYTVG